jgi:hypothetical protein
LFVGMVLFAGKPLQSISVDLHRFNLAKYATTEAPCAATRMSIAEHKNIAIRLALVELQP